MSSASSDRSAVLAAQLIARDGYRWREAFDTVFAETGERPPEESVARELRRWYAIFRPIDHRRSLRRKRTAALGLMTFLEESLGATPKLVGRVLDGAASDDAVAEVVLDTDDEKAPCWRSSTPGSRSKSWSLKTARPPFLPSTCPKTPYCSPSGRVRVPGVLSDAQTKSNTRSNRSAKSPPRSSPFSSFMTKALSATD